jgi:hypothetical protein
MFVRMILPTSERIVYPRIKNFFTTNAQNMSDPDFVHATGRLFIR